jgi:twinfilin-like protein
VCLSFEGQSTAISLQYKSHNKHNAVRNIRCVSEHLCCPAARLISQFTASQELHDAFNQLVSSPSQRGLLATIKNETLVPLETLQANQDFRSDLSGLSQHLSKDEARYILLKQDGSAADGYVAVTYVPDTANVRQKMLFASTRLTLVRELGVERFRETVFCTTAEELTPAGWDRHEKHNRLDAPLTEEEAGLKHIKDTEALESSGGTGGRSLPSAGIALNLGDEVSNALESLKDSREGSLVMIVSPTCVCASGRAKLTVPTEN